ncbi:MAG: L-dopachrome tautomerase-related protein [Hyphomonas sp.]|uniref:L-dopachrome tautomerase-related protein n=1 Tax=Hyphomonas sp. TaxID=87 RepID=UPI0032F00FB8
MAKILISGATGFIAGHTIERLLSAGHDIVGTVREPGQTEKVRHLLEMDGAAEHLTLVAADLTDPNAFAAHTDVDVIFHMASPYIMNVKDPQRDLIEPALRGTLSMLEAAAKSNRVKRVILTSSMAAITDEPDGRVLTEDDWNTESSLTRNAYYFSKAEAERAAWKFMKRETPGFDLIVINPFLVIGPAHTQSINTSNQTFIDMIKGTYPAIMALDWGFVDVRDVADAHIAAMITPSASGRYICASGNLTMEEVVSLIREEGYGATKLPSMRLTGSVGTTLMKLASYAQPQGVGSYLRTHLGRHPRFDNSKIKLDLGIAFRTPEQSVRETLADLTKWGHIPAPETNQTSRKKGTIDMWIKRGLLALIAVVVIFFLGFKLMYGGGKPYPDVSTAPLIEAASIETPISLQYPPGMVAASPDGRIFYTYHMLHKPERFADATVFEWVDGKGVPFPSATMQTEFHGAMGVTADRQGRLWIIKPGALEGKPTRLIAVNMASGEMVVDHTFAKNEAGFAQDMRVSPDGRTVYLADTGLFRFSKAGLIVFDVETQSARTLLKGHPSVSPQNWVMRKTNGNPYRLAFGLLTFVVGVDGIALTEDGDWLYFAAMSHDTVYRVPSKTLLDQTLSDDDVAEQIVFVGNKPMSDGIELLPDNTLLMTDVENGGLATLSPDGTLTTLTKDPRVDWADSVTVAPDGSIWFTDSRLTDLIDQFAAPSDEATMRERGPYPIYRINPDALAQPLSE